MCLFLFAIKSLFTLVIITAFMCFRRLNETIFTSKCLRCHRYSPSMLLRGRNQCETTFYGRIGLKPVVVSVNSTANWKLCVSFDGSLAAKYTNEIELGSIFFCFFPLSFCICDDWTLKNDSNRSQCKWNECLCGIINSRCKIVIKISSTSPKSHEIFFPLLFLSSRLASNL